MIKPDPNNSRICREFADYIEKVHATDTDDLEYLKSTGDPLFTEEELRQAIHPLDRLVRRICVERNITTDYFREKHDRQCAYMLGMLPEQAQNKRSNLLKALKQGDITMKRFLEMVCFVLELDIKNMIVECKDKVDGKTHCYALTTSENITKPGDASESNKL